MGSRLEAGGVQHEWEIDNSNNKIDGLEFTFIKTVRNQNDEVGYHFPSCPLSSFLSDPLFIYLLLLYYLLLSPPLEELS